MRCLISTIIRNRGTHVPTWCDQLVLLTKQNPNIKFYLSVFENDSEDNTKQVLRLVEKKFQNHFEAVKVTTSDLGWHTSVQSKQKKGFVIWQKPETKPWIKSMISMDLLYSTRLCVLSQTSCIAQNKSVLFCIQI